MENKCQLFLQHCEKFRWFITRFFGEEEFERCKKLAEDNLESELLSELNGVWFYLPDDQFNIREMPEGWSEFLQCIEEYVMEVTREQFQRFNEIRNSGVTNMLDSNVVCRLADITPEVHRYIVNNYNELLNKYGDDID